ncbi:MAG: HAD family hydrolase [bacterium]
MDYASGGPRRPWIFMDAGDTFIYGYPTFYEALRDCFLPTGRTLSLDDARAAVAAYMKRNPPLELVTQERFSGYFLALYRAVLESLDYPADAGAGAAWLWAEWESGHRLRLFGDARAVLESLRDAGFRLGVISNWDLTFEAVLRRLGVSGLFEVRVASCAVGIAKPDERIFRIALGRAGVTPAEAWYLGDRVDTDIAPAKRLGMGAILVDYYGQESADGAADYHAASLSEAARFILQEETGRATGSCGSP